MKKTYLIKAKIEIEVFANDEREALMVANSRCDVEHFNPTSVLCYEDED